MSWVRTVDYTAALLALGLAAAALWQRPRGLVRYAFAGGLLLLGAEAVCRDLAVQSLLPLEAMRWQTVSLCGLALVPGTWLLFSITYARGNYQQFLVKWRAVWLLGYLLPLLMLAAGFSHLVTGAFYTAESDMWVIQLGWAGMALHLILLLACVLILMNLERTLSAGYGTMRWRIKFMVLGLALVFAVRIYTGTQAVLYSAVNLDVASFNSVALIFGCLLLAGSMLRAGLFNVEVYPSTTLIQRSLTVLLAGSYLLIVGVLAKTISQSREGSAFPLHALLVMVALLGLSVLLLSDRFKQKTSVLLSRHLRRPRYDSRRVWTTFTERTGSVLNKEELCRRSGTLLSETFQILSVTTWLVNEQKNRLVHCASTSLASSPNQVIAPIPFSPQIQEVFRARQFYPTDIDEIKDSGFETLKQANPGVFPKGGHRVCVPLVSGGDLIGLMILGDRVQGALYTTEELDLVKCIGDQVASHLLSLQLSEKVLQAKEMEAFQKMSAFFVHDLKNTASTLSLMLENLPVHFDDPEFRQDALRGLGKSINRINDLVQQLSMFRQQMEPRRTKADLNQLVQTAVDLLPELPSVTLEKNLQPMPAFSMDPEQIRKVISNFLVNAVEAMAQQGVMRLETQSTDGWACLSVSDSGCGMSREFLEQSLFRPFQTTKKKGVGIGMFLNKSIVEAHQGRIEVESEEGKGTTFRIYLPIERPNETQVTDRR